MTRFTLLTLSTLVGFAAQAALAAPQPEHANAIRGITWSGEIFPRGGIVEIEGTAEEIYNEIKRRNPDHDFMAPNPLVAREINALYARDIKGGPVGCDALKPTSHRNATHEIDTLYRLGNSGNCKIAAKSKGKCVRTSCYMGATYVCAESDKEVSFPCGNLIYVMESILNTCTCKKGNTELVNGKWYSSGEGAFSLWLGAGNCDDLKEQRPTEGNGLKFKKDDFCEPPKTSVAAAVVPTGSFLPKKPYTGFDPNRALPGEKEQTTPIMPSPSPRN